MAITIHDVARRAGIGDDCVSRALAEPQLVRETTRARVLAVAKQLAYHPNQAARSLITGKTGNIGIIVPDLDNPFYPSVTQSNSLSLVLSNRSSREEFRGSALRWFS